MDRSHWSYHNNEHYYDNDHYYSQAYQEGGQHTFQPETGQTSTGTTASGASGSHSSGSYPASDQPYLDLNTPVQIPSWSWLDGETSQSTTLEDVSQHHALSESFNPQPVVAARQRRSPAQLKAQFLADLDNYAQGVKLTKCSSSLRFWDYINDNGNLVRGGISLYEEFSDAEKAQLDQAIIARQGAKLIQSADKESVTERFLEGLDNYAQGVLLKDCSATLDFGCYATDEGELHQKGRNLRAILPPAAQDRVNQALLRRRQTKLEQAMVNAPAGERFLAGLEKYARGAPLTECSATLEFKGYVSDLGYLHAKGRYLRATLLPEDQERVDRALTDRRRIAAERLSGDVPHFQAALLSYGNGLDLQTCGKQSGLKRKIDRYQKIERYFTQEGGLAPKGELLIENLQPDQQNEVWRAIKNRRRCLDPSAQVPEVPASMPEQGGMDPTAMVDPMQTEAMWATVWQLTGQVVPGPSESAEPLIHHYDNNVAGADFQHQYDLYA
jgi:hypothetical protein